MWDLLERLNSPIAVLATLAFLLIVDGSLLLYSYSQSLQTSESNVGNPLVEEEKVRITVRVVDDDFAGLRVSEDGRTVFERVVVNPGFSREFEAKEKITITAFNAGAVRVVSNGYDQGPLGESGEVVSSTFLRT